MPVNGKLSGDSIYELLLDIHVGISLINVFTTSLVRSRRSTPRGRPRSDVCHRPQQVSLARVYLIQRTPLSFDTKTCILFCDTDSLDGCSGVHKRWQPDFGMVHHRMLSNLSHNERTDAF